MLWDCFHRLRVAIISNFPHTFLETVEYKLKNYPVPFLNSCLIVSLLKYMPGMISVASAIRKYIAWYAFRILCHTKVYCLVCFQNPLS